MTREQLAAELGTLVRGKRLAVDWSPDGAIPYLDGVPLGVAELLRSLGATLVPSAELVTRYCSVWSPADVASHRRAAEAIAAIAREALALAGSRAATAEPINEHALAVWVRERFDRAGLVTESGPSVSWGPNAARAHYDPTPEESAPIVRGAHAAAGPLGHGAGRDLCRPDLDGGDRPPVGARRATLWSVVRRARDAALDLIRSRVRGGAAVRGAEADAAAREVITAAGYADRTIARTGHSIDRYGLHGFGPPIDDTETYDDRLLIPGVGFSVEPGVYFPGEAGVRSEVNVVVGDGDVEITPRAYQSELLVV